MGLISEGVDLLKLANKAQNADLYKELAGWIDRVTDLQKQNDQLKTERDELREEIRFKGIVERIKGHTFVQGDDEEICPRCAEVDRKPVHLLPRMPQKSGWPKAACPQCHTPTVNAMPLSREEAQKKNLSPAIG
jgi:hypothetical protein